MKSQICRLTGLKAWVSGLLLLGLGAITSQSATLPEGVEMRPLGGWKQMLVMDASETNITAIVVPEIGGRILHYGLDGQNIIFDNPDARGKTPATSPDGFWAGGYQCDVGPELGYPPEHKDLWMGPWQWEAPRDFFIKVTSEPDKILGLQLTKEILMDPDTGELGIVQQMKNISIQEQTYCLWDRTLCAGGGFAFFPLNKKSRFKAGWAIRRGSSPHYSFDGDTPSSPQVKIMDGVLVAETKGEATKVGADSDAQWIAYVKGRLLFVKYYPYDPKGTYSDGGNSVELYFDPRVAELEPLSPSVTLKPGKTYSFPEKWILIPLNETVTTFEQARALVKKIPAPPFGKQD